ncbi:putative antirepressor [Paenibacillus sp. JCM 10914]|nr:putative antirepressor [Paenibacillus sp. JCM 10914]
MTGKRHDHLLRDIDGYCEILMNSTDPKIGVSDFFEASTYQDGTGRTLRGYDLTRKGCDMVANKMTGEKGVLFTATYVTKFDEMEKSQSLDLTGLSPQLQLLIAMEHRQLQIEQRQQQTESQLTTIKETFLQRDDNWRQKINGLLNGAARSSDMDHKEVRNMSYQILKDRTNCKLETRLENLRKRLSDSGATKTRIADANKLDIIESDKMLKEIYTTIVKELSIGTLV